MPSPTLANGDIGATCTGEADGGFAQGSCATGEYCLSFLSQGPTCTQVCAINSCPGTTACVPQIPLLSGSDSLCVPGCLTGQSNSGCANGQSCMPRTPNPNDPGYCVQGCTTSTQCNAAGSGTSFACVNGNCLCTGPNDCPQESCDTVSGTCYAGCTGTPDCEGFGCCAQTGSIDYCDLQQGGSGGTSGSSGSFTVGAHAAYPQIPNNGGVVLSNPKVYTATYATYDQREGVETWSAWVTGSSWMTAVGADYGVGLGATQAIHLAGSAPVTIDDTYNPDGGLTQMTTWINSLLGDALPAPDANTLYMIYFPASTTVTYNGWSSCNEFGGYHGSFVAGATPGTPTVAYAVIPECAQFAQESYLSTLEYTEVAASHELIEAATDPYSSATTYVLYDPSNAWTYLYGEVGDLCVGTSTYYDETGLFAAQRIWSNSAARTAGSPCIPLATQDPVFIAASPPDPNGNELATLSPGHSVTVTLEGWSTAPFASWYVSLYQTGGGDNFGGAGPTVTITPQYAVISNNGTAQFTLTMPSTTPSGSGDYAVLSAYSYVGGYAADTMSWPVVYYAP